MKFKKFLKIMVFAIMVALFIQGPMLVKANISSVKKLEATITMETMVPSTITKNMLEETGDQFYRAFIEENRYMFLVDGLMVTLRLSFFAAFLGIFLGGVLAMFKMTQVVRQKNTIFSIVADIYIDVIRGTPVAVQLLIMYFVVFPGTVSPEIVAIVTFGINSGAYVAEIFRAGILGIDHGQTEAGRSLGLSYPQTMWYIILPQAIKNILPALGNEFIVLVKETAIVGLIAVADLTKSTDYIISRVSMSFMPLIGAACIYFVIIKILSILLKKLERRLRRSDMR